MKPICQLYRVPKFELKFEYQIFIMKARQEPRAAAVGFCKQGRLSIFSLVETPIGRLLFFVSSARIPLFT